MKTVLNNSLEKTSRRFSGISAMIRLFHYHLPWNGYKITSSHTSMHHSCLSDVYGTLESQPILFVAPSEQT